MGRYKVFCDGVILPSGGAQNFYCYSSDAPASLVEAATRAARKARFMPATIDDKKLSVRMLLMAIVQITQDKDDPLVLVVPNNGADAGRYGLFYSAPQRYNSFRWTMDQFVPQPRENIRVIMNMSIDDHGDITQHSAQNVAGAEPELLGVIERRMANMKFIPGFFRRKPVPMIYTELMYFGFA